MSNIYSRAAFLAQSSLKDRGINASKGHIREIVAAVHGFNSLAAMQAAMPLGLDRLPRVVVVHPDKMLALKRASELEPPADSSAIVTQVMWALGQTATMEHFYLNQIHDVPRTLEALARKLVLARPEMERVVDDYEGRVAGAVSSVVQQSGKPIDPDQEKVLRMMAENNGPIVIYEAASDPHPAGRLYRLVGDYTDANGDTGIVRIHILFKQTGQSIYGLHNTDAIFTKGPGYEEFYGIEHLSEMSTIGGMG